MVDVFRTPKTATNRWMPDAIVEGWTSLVWTERFRDAGEFQLTTPAVAETLALIPDGSLICISDSPEIMMVENHSIDVNDDGVKMLTVSGRSFVAFLENRIFKADTGLPYEMKRDYTADEAAAVILVDKLANGSATDLTGGPNPHDNFEFLAGVAVTSYLTVPQKALSTTTPPDLTDLQSKAPWYLDNSKSAYDFLQSILAIGDFGVRCARPRTAPLGSKYVVDPTTGVVTQPTPCAATDLQFILYNGRQRTITENPYDPVAPVIFDYSAGHLETPKYLISRKGYKNACRVVSSEGEVSVYLQADGTVTTTWSLSPAFLDRYEMNLDLGQVDASITDPAAWMLQQGTLALKTNNRQLIVDAAVNENTPDDYFYDAGFEGEYFLGDKVSVIGEYGIVEDMLVTEYVRSYDLMAGDKAYPTLTHISPTA